MVNIQLCSKKINALLMCHLPLAFAFIVLKFSLTQSDAFSLQLNLLTIIGIIGLSPLALLLLTKFPLNLKSGYRIESLTPAIIDFMALTAQITGLIELLSDRKLSETGYTEHAALIPILIVGEALPTLNSALQERGLWHSYSEKILLILGFCLLAVDLAERQFLHESTAHKISLLIGFLASLYGLILFYVSRYRTENAKMLSILLYYCLQSQLMSFFIPVFDSLLNNSILSLGIVFALTLASVFLRPEALEENGFSISLANRRLRDAYERKISDSASLANATLDSLTAHICILDSEGVITAVNKSWRKFALCLSSNESDNFIGRNFTDFFEKNSNTEGSHSQQLLAGVRQVLSGKCSDFLSTYPCLIKNIKRWFICRVSRFETSHGPCAVVALEDITELKSAEEDLLLKTAAIERANDGIVLSDPALPDHPVVYVSPGFLKLTGYTADEVLGRNCRFLQGPDTDPTTIKVIAEAISRKMPFVGDIINYKKDGRAWINRLKLEPIFDEHGHLLRYLGVQSDVTEQRKLENERNKALEQERLARIEVEKHFQEAKSANALKDEFLATLSHELRTPAGVISGFVELLKYEKLSSSEEEEALDAIERNSRSLVTLIDDILDVSRVITGKFKLNPKPVDLAGVVESVISAELLAAQAKNIRIVTEFEPGLGPVYGDVTRLQQIFWNLLSNAIKFTPRNGRVKVTLKMDGGRALVRVADTGVGIDAKFLPHVFERFRQQDSGMNRTYGGLGLGLSIVKHLVELHGGGVWAESAGQGRGSTFTVSLPVLTSSG